MTTYRRNALVRFQTRKGSKIRNGRIEGKWAKGEGDGYSVASGDDYYDVPASRIVGPQVASKKPYWKR